VLPGQIGEIAVEIVLLLRAVVDLEIPRRERAPDRLRIALDERRVIREVGLAGAPPSAGRTAP
jgi:hypothetical protein